MAVNQQTVAQALQRAGVSVFNLQVEDAGGVIALRGDVHSQADKDKAQQVVQGLGVAAANYLTVQGVSGGVTMGSVAAADAAATTAASAKRYTVKSGDTLSKIAKQVYGDASQWKKIHEANRAKIPNPDLIHPGDELTIPQ
jgi:nucleoid-associated protein YgaU